MMRGLTDINLEKLHRSANTKDLRAALGTIVRPAFAKLWEDGRYRFSMLELMMAPEEPLPWLPLEADEGIGIVQLVEWTKALRCVSMYLPLRAERYMSLQIGYPETVLKLPGMTLCIGELADSGYKAKEHTTRYIPYAKIYRCAAASKPFDKGLIRAMADVLLRVSVCGDLDEFLSETPKARVKGGCRL